MKLVIIKCKQDKLIDSELAGLFCSTLKEFNLLREQNSITQEKKERIDKTLNIIKEKLTKLTFSSNQTESFLANSLLRTLFAIKFYVRALEII